VRETYLWQCRWARTSIAKTTILKSIGLETSATRKKGREDVTDQHEVEKNCLRNGQFAGSAQTGRQRRPPSLADFFASSVGLLQKRAVEKDAR
jgi:hypothetical protein